MHPIITVILTDNRKFSFEIYEDISPNAINGLIETVYNHSNDNQKIERVVPEFVLQPWYNEKNKTKFQNCVIDNEINDIPFDIYSVGLAGDGISTSSPSCFFICIGKEKIKRLNGHFMNVGKVISGFDVIEEIMKRSLIKIENDEAEIYEPEEPVIIKTMTIELNGYIPSACTKYLPDSYVQ